MAPCRHAPTIRPGMLPGYARPDTKTLVSKTMRRLGRGQPFLERAALEGGLPRTLAVMRSISANPSCSGTFA